MAVMSNKKKALGQLWAFKNKQRQEANKEDVKEEIKEEKPLTKEEHEERINALKKLGLIK